jgi:MFS family permease
VRPVESEPTERREPGGAGGLDTRPGSAPRRVYALLSAVSVVEFTALAFFTFGLVAILRRRGVGLDVLGLVQLVQVVPALRFAWAPLVDRYGRPGGHYRSWLLGLLPALALVAVALSALRPEHEIGLLLALVVVVALLGATTNTTTDALTVVLLDEPRRGFGNGLRTAGGYAGSLLSGGALLVAYDRLGWTPTLLAVAALALLPLLTMVGFREPARPVLPRPRLRDSFAPVVSVLRRPGAARWALGVLPLYWTGVYAAYTLVDPMLVDAHWSLSRVGLAVNTPAQLTALCCGVLAGFLLTRIGRRRALVLGGVSQVVAVAALLPLALGAAPTVPTALAVCAVQASYALSATVVTTVSMTFCRPRSAGTDAGVLAAVGSAVTAVASAVALPVAGLTGYPVAVGLCALLACAATVVAGRLSPGQHA